MFRRTPGDALRRISWSIVHRYVSPSDRHPDLDTHSTKLVNMAVCCLQLIRPTRRSRAQNVPGIIRDDGTLDAHGFSANHDQADVPEIQKLFSVWTQDIQLLAYYNEPR